MAVVVGVVGDAYDFSEAQGPAGATVKVMHCLVNVTYPTGTYATADDSNFAPAAAIQSRRNGKTPTILQAAFYSPGDENGVVIGAGACTVSGGTVTNPLTQADLTTERANGAMASALNWNRPVSYKITFTEPK